MSALGLAAVLVRAAHRRWSACPPHHGVCSTCWGYVPLAETSPCCGARVTPGPDGRGAAATADGDGAHDHRVPMGRRVKAT